MGLIEDQSWIDCIDITSRWDAFVSFHLYGNKGVSLPLWPIRPRWFHTYRPCAEPLGDGHEGMWARFGSQGSIALNWHSRYSGTRYSGTWLYLAGRSYQIPQICLVKVRAFKFCTVFELIMLLSISSVFYLIPICLFFINLLTIHLLISLGTLLASKNIEGMVWSFSNLACRCS